MTGDIRELILSDGTVYHQDIHGNLIHINDNVEEEAPPQSRVATMFESFSRRLLDGTDELDTDNSVVTLSNQTFSNSDNNVVADFSSYNFASEEDFSSEPIENFNFGLFETLHGRIDFPENATPQDVFNRTMREYRRFIRNEPSERIMGNTRRVLVSSLGEVSVRPSNRTMRARGRNPYRPMFFSGATFSTADIGSLGSGRVVAADTAVERPLDYFAEYMGSTSDEISTVWHQSDRPMRSSVPSLGRQLRPKYCYHKACIKCGGKGEDGRGNACPHNYECPCVECNV